MLSDRHSHSSCVHKDKLYILGGWREFGYMNTIEVIDADAIIRHCAGETSSLPTWEAQIVLPNDFTQRLYPLFAPFEQDEIIILGGRQRGTKHRACFIFNTCKRSFRSLNLDAQDEAFALGIESQSNQCI